MTISPNAAVRSSPHMLSPMLDVMAQLIAEDLVLLIYRPDGTARGKGTKLDLALAGALLTELALQGHIELADKRLRSIDGVDRPEHPELAAALAHIAAKPRTPEAILPKLAKRLRPRLLTGLVTAGVLAREPRRVAGVIPSARFPLIDAGPRDEVRRRLDIAVIQGGEASQRTAALASLIHTAGLASKIFPDNDKRAVRARLGELADGDWGSEALRKAIRAAIVSQAIAIAISTTISTIANGE